MTLKNQWETMKDNWLIVLLVIVVLGAVLFAGGNGGISPLMESASYDSSAKMSAGAADYGVRSSIAPYPSSDNFAPDVTQRIITKTASLSSEVQRGRFMDADAKLKNIVKSSDSFLLNENVNNYGTKQDSQYSGSYQIKVDTAKYDSIIQQLREIGEVKSFNENAEDITGQYTDLKTELEAEKERMRRYQEMYSQAASIEDKINLNDRIFNQERTIKYYEDAIKNMDNRVSYSSIYVTLTEKQSGYASIALVRFGELVRSLVNSFNSLLKLIFWALPYAVAGILIWLVVRFARRKKK